MTTSGFETELELLKNSSLAQRVASMTQAAGGGASGSDKAQRAQAAANAVLGGIAVKAVPNTRLVDVSYTDPDPAQAQRIANAFGEAYIASNLDKRFQANAYAKSFLEDQLSQYKLRLEDAEKAQLAFAEKEQIVATTDKASLADSDLAAANAALGGLISERIKNEQLWRQAEERVGHQHAATLDQRGDQQSAWSTRPAGRRVSREVGNVPRGLSGDGATHQ